MHVDVKMDFLNKELTAMSNRWLEWQCKLMSDVKFGAIYIANQPTQDETLVQQIALWPEKAPAPPSRIQEISQEILKTANCSIHKEQCLIDSNDSVCELFSVPVKNREQVVGVVSIMLSVRSEEQKKAVLQLLQWGVVWLESLLFKAFDEIYKSDAVLADAAEILTIDEPFQLTAHKICNVVNERFKCQRVALGLVKGMRVKLLGLSGQLDFSSESELIRMIELAMEESSEQSSLIHYSEQNKPQTVTLHHQKFVEVNPHTQVISIPVSSGENALGVLFLQKDSSSIISTHETKLLQRLAKLIALPLLQHKSRKQFFNKPISDGSKGLINRFLGQDYVKLKLVAISLLLSLTALNFVNIEQKVYAQSDIVGSVQYQVIAPQAGFIESAKLRAGDLVSKGSPILILDRKDLLLEKQKLESELAKVSQNYQQALAKKERSEIGIAVAEKAQIQAKIDLVMEKFKRSVIRSPIDGLVVSGDLSQMLGSPVDKGQKLFELAPLENYRVLLSIDEHDIAKVSLNQHGVLRLTGLPYEPIGIKLTRITSQSEAREGANYFRIEADVVAGDISIKPGMQGVAQINVGQASVLSVWTQSAIDRLRLWLWSMGW